MLFLVRHGETQNNREGRLQGRVDTPLTELGRTQAEAVANVCAHHVQQHGGLVRVVTSPLARAVETAEIIAARVWGEVSLDERLTEIDYGAWEGRIFQEVLRDEDAAWRTDPTFAPPGGESIERVAARVAAFVQSALPEGDDQSVLTIAVSHVSPIKAAVTHVLGVDPMRAWQMHLDLASLTRLGRHRNTLVLRAFNETEHLHDRRDFTR